MKLISAFSHVPKRNNGATFRPRFVLFLALQFVLFPALVQAASQDQQKQALGSLSSVGEVYVNDSPAPTESTIFSGDTLRTGMAGTATFVTSGKGSFKMTSRSLMVFAGTPQFVAELKSGTVMMSSLSGPTGINLRAGNYVVVAVTQGDQSTSKIDAAADGSFVVTCVEGSVGVLPLEGANGLFLQMGQSITISAQGELSATKAPVPPPSTPPPPTPTNVQKKSYTGWIILAAAGAGGAGAVAALAGKKGSSVSPATP